jgi:hypothetical protein
MVERAFDNGLHIPVSDEGGAVSMSVVGANSALGVTRVSSFVSDDESKTICVYDGLDSEAIHPDGRRAQRPAGPSDHEDLGSRSVLLLLIADSRLTAPR